MKKKHGNISRHRHVYKNNCVFAAIPFYIQEMAVCFPITKQKEPIIIRFISCDYRLCVNASGSVITEIFKFFTLIRFSCLHFGQYRGKSLFLYLPVSLIGFYYCIQDIKSIFLVAMHHLISNQTTFNDNQKQSAEKSLVPPKW